jgi:UDP:flavonoid glycosyltransferase YjiC (YdhE family)
LLGDAAYLARAREVGDLLAAEDGAEQAARIVLDMLEQLARK